MAPSPADRLDPVGRLRLPRRPTLVRAVLVAGLLLTAAGVLYAGGDPPAPPAPAAERAEPAPGPGRATPDQPRPAEGPPAGPQRLPIPAGRVGVPVSLGDPARVAVLRPGDRVDLLAVPTAGGDPVPLATGSPVLAVDHAAAILLLGLTPEQGRAVLATPAATTTFAVIVRG
jgi:hypothetical protein